MANNLDLKGMQERWDKLKEEAGEVQLEIFVLRKDGQAVMMERELKDIPLYAQAMVAGLLGIPRKTISKITVMVDGEMLT